MQKQRYDVTLIIPSHNRHCYLERSIRFFSSLNAIVILCDSSGERYQGKLGENTVYHHLPGMSFVDKMIFALETTNTTYTACCADDDFILHSAIYEGVDFLASNKECCSFLGRYLAFNLNETGLFERYDYRETVIKDCTPKTRAMKFFSNYKIMLWALHDRKTLLEAYRIIKESYITNDNFIEFVIAALACARGKVKVTDAYWGVREVNPGDHWGQRHETLNHIFSDAGIRADFNKIRCNLDRVTESGYSSTALISYLIFCMKLYLKHNFILVRLINKCRRHLCKPFTGQKIQASTEQMAELVTIQAMLGESV